MRRPTDADDALDDLQQVAVVLEDDVGFLELAFALDVDLIVAVDQDVGDRRVAQQRFERPEAEQLVDARREISASRSNRLSGVARLSRSTMPTIRLRISGSASSRRMRVEPIEVQPVQQLLVDAALQLLVVRAAHVHAQRRR